MADVITKNKRGSFMQGCSIDNSWKSTVVELEKSLACMFIGAGYDVPTLNCIEVDGSYLSFVFDEDVKWKLCLPKKYTITKGPEKVIGTIMPQIARNIFIARCKKTMIGTGSDEAMQVITRRLLRSSGDKLFCMENATVKCKHSPVRYDIVINFMDGKKISVKNITEINIAAEILIAKINSLKRD